jgi:hypothetical protein
MAVVDIQSVLAARNPEHRAEQIANTVHEIDESVTMLAFAKDSAALCEAEDQLISGLALIHGRLRRECDRLFQLL